ncbi:hypothetical protein HGRIS_003754 [Hohenbuehelia grisea]|uniref:Ankyrin n=1 Tax=Hohenbuehelia grisea TaxID=104357 RepID=A0ABR3JGJ5_9AGAR
MTNIWVSASDGKLQDVKNLIENNIASPNDHDSNSYTPMHAAASYGHLHVLEYLISKGPILLNPTLLPQTYLLPGGDVNLRDDDGDTPLYTVENIQTAAFLLQHGALIDTTNNQGISPIDHLREDFPQVAAFLEARLAPASPLPPAQLLHQPQPSQHQQNAATEELTSQLMTDVHSILARADADGREPDEAELRAAVSRAVLDGVVTGFDLSQNPDAAEHQGHPRPDDQADSPAKRPRTEGDL